MKSVRTRDGDDHEREGSHANAWSHRLDVLHFRRHHLKEHRHNGKAAAIPSGILMKPIRDPGQRHHHF